MTTTITNKDLDELTRYGRLWTQGHERALTEAATFLAIARPGMEKTRVRIAFHEGLRNNAQFMSDVNLGMMYLEDLSRKLEEVN